MDYSLNLKETQTDNPLENEKESEIDWDNSDNSLVKIGDFFIKIDTLLNLLNVEIENDSSEESNKILIRENPSDEIIENTYNPDTDTKLITNIEVNLNSVSESSESSPGISQLKVPSKEHDEIIKIITEEDNMDLIEVPPIFDLYEV